MSYTESTRVLLLGRRVRIDLPQRPMNKEAKGSKGHIIDVIESSGSDKYRVVVETDGGDQYTCIPSALSPESCSGVKVRARNLKQKLKEVRVKIEDALKVGGASDELQEVRSHLTEALEI